MEHLFRADPSTLEMAIGGLAPSAPKKPVKLANVRRAGAENTIGNKEVNGC
jgi:hypothetical protein